VSGVSDAVVQRLMNLGKDPVEFISRLKIIDEKGIERFFDKPYDEQRIALHDFLVGAKSIVHCKPRQIGDTTVGCAWNFTYGYWCLDPVRTLIVANDVDATDSIFKRLKYFHDSLPTVLQRPLARSNRKEMEFSDTGVVFRCLTAGGRGHGRSFTFQRLHADEVAYWPNDEAVWASVTSTLHDGPHKQIFVTSTPNGPGNLFHRKVLDAQRDPSAVFRFFRWSDHRAYRLQAPPKWEPTQEEWDLKELFDLDINQLYWRHQKINGADGIGEARFRREYPLTVEEGFMEVTGSWFDQMYLNEVIATLRPPDMSKELRIFKQPEAGMAYGVGVDPSWGTGNDYSVAQVLSRDGEQVAVFTTNKRSPEDFAIRVAELAFRYNGARVLCEWNTGGGGPVVIHRLREMGVPLWYNPANGDHFKMTGGRNGLGRKAQVYSHLRYLVDGDSLTLTDLPTVQEMMHVREEDGKVEGRDGYHDDLCDALALAAWNMKTLPEPLMGRAFPFKRKRKAIPHPFGM
tara:strand:- start:4785 stop:6326 length:1542 start_codon:yes stop_codon:yes gene_type:complete